MASADVLRVMRSPRWIAGLLVAMVTVVVFAGLGMWQLRRLDERRAVNTEIAAGREQDPIALSTLLAESEDPTQLAWRRVTAEGVYVPELEMILNGRSHKARPGHNVLTPLVLGTGDVLIVNRGWVPFEAEGPPVPEAEPPQGRVRVAGTLRRGEGAGLLSGGSGDGPVQRITTIDLQRIAVDLEIGDPLGVYLQLSDQTPAQELLPEPVPLPDPSEGPHLAYAVQWFVFAIVVLVGFPTLVWRTARSRGASVA